MIFNAFRVNALCRSLFLWLLLAFVWIFFAGPLSAYAAGDDSGERSGSKIRYVRENGSGLKDGSSWADASDNLQEMINASNAGDKVFVAAGTYYAINGKEVTDERGFRNSRQRAFVMKSGVVVYGGFDPQNPETDESARAYQPDARYGWQLKNISLLTGKLPEGGVRDGWVLDTIGWRWQPVGYMDNTTHVVWFASGGFTGAVLNGEVTRANALPQEAVLDGFSVDGGYADGCGQDIQGSSARFGGGVYLVDNGVVRNCIIRENFAVTRGGGVFMNYGGRVSDCFIARNSSPGYNLVRNGLGGGVYIVGKGLVERSFVVNNNARRGGGIYLEKEHHEVPYETVVEMSVIANNTASNEGGGVYCDSAGVLTGVMIVRNNCMDPGLTGNGKTGGGFVDHYAVVTSSGLYGNTASMSSRQGYGINITAPDEMTKTPASVQIVHSAIENMTGENFGMATLKDVVTIDDEDNVYASRFVRNLEKAGLVPTSSYPSVYLGMADWDKDPCSVLVLRGASSAEAPYFSEAEFRRVNIPLLTIDRKPIDRQPDVGPYVCKVPAVNHATLPDGTKIVYVDNRSEVCGDGSSWANPTRLLVPAMQYLEDVGGGEVWVKEGTYLPTFSEIGTTPQEFIISMKSNVKLYGGFPHNVASPGMDLRDPLAYRTIIEGDIGIKGDYTDNSYHLVLFDSSLTGSSVIDGFYIRNANALPEPETHGKAGAVCVNSPYAVIRNCVIENCLALEGAAVYSTQPFRMENCVINNNDSREGAVVVAVSGTKFINVTVVLNKGVGIAGGDIMNSLIWGNTGTVGEENTQVSGIAPGEINYCAIQKQERGVTGTGNIELSPDFEEGLEYLVNPTTVAGMIREGYGTVHGGPAVMEPTCLSSMINKGKAGAGYSSTDIRGVERGRGGAWDIGAFESTCMPESGVWYVREGGTGDGTSWEKASGDLFRMVEKAKPGEQIWVAGGEYSYKGELLQEQVVVGVKNSGWQQKPQYETRSRYKNFIMKEGVDVYGGFPNYGTPSMNERHPHDTSALYRTVLSAVKLTSQEVKSGYKRGRVLEQARDFAIETTWDGFTIRGGQVEIDDGEDGGAGVLLRTNGRLVNCYITENVNEVVKPRYTKGEGWLSQWTVKTVQIRGGGVHCRGGSLVNCYIIGNAANALTENAHEAFGGGLYVRNGTVYNCVITGNKCSGVYALGCAAYVEQADFYNNTITQNKGEGYTVSAISVGGFMTDSKLQIMNCIICGNDGEAIADNFGKLGSVTYSFYAGATGGTNMDAGAYGDDPGFVSVTDFRLTATSPCINSGNTYPEGITLPETDMDYTERIKDCAIDMGAYEFGDPGGGLILPDLTRPDTAVVYVTQYGRGRADGSSWEEAVCRSKLQRAIDVLSRRTESVRQLWIGTGKLRNTDTPLASAVFYPTVQWNPTELRSYAFRIRAGVTVMGSFAGTEADPDDRLLQQEPPITILSGDFKETPDNIGDDAFHVVIFDSLNPGESAALENVVVQYGNADHHDLIRHQNGGGIVLMAGGKVWNCGISYCQALHKGGGVYMVDRPEDWPVQMWGAALTGSLVRMCKASKGGGVYAGRYAQVTGNTIAQNDAAAGGGLAFTYPAAIQGTVLWNNTGENGKDIYGMTDVPYEHGYESVIPELPGRVYPVNYSAIEGQWVEGQFNINLSPENEGSGLSPAFVNPVSGNMLNGGWKLKSNSALIDKGLNNVVMKVGIPELLQHYALAEKDMGGNKRIHTYFSSSRGDYMDIGAYESNEDIRLNSDKYNRLYVTRAARGKMDGSSWKNATSDIQSALDYFKNSTRRGEVWVQGGYSYVPLRLINDSETDARAASFVLNPNVDLYGGFMGDTVNDPVGGRVSESELSQRLRNDKNKNGVYEEYEFLYATVLDAGINPAKGYEHNAYHILYYENKGMADTVVIDGFTFQHGQAVCAHAKQQHQQGGAVYALSPVSIRNSIFLDNYAVLNGGAVYAAGGGKIESSLFGTNGVMNGKGGAVYIKNGLIANTLIANNTAQYGQAGGVYAEGGQVVNCVIASNNATHSAGIYLQGAEAVNTVVWNNAVQSSDVMEIGGLGSAVHCALPAGRIEASVSGRQTVLLNADNSAPDGPHFILPTLTSVTEAYDWAADWRIHVLSPLADGGDSVVYRSSGLPLSQNFVQYKGSGTVTHIARIQGRNIDIGCYETKPVRLADRDTLYVRTWENPAGLADGSSWENATSDLQAAIEKLESRPLGGRKQIWVAQGEYVPTCERQKGNIVSRSFVIRKGGIEIYGGFPDDKESNSNPGMSERQPVRFETVLNGAPTRSRHVVYGEATEAVMLLDGFTITGGQAAETNEEGKGTAVYVTADAYLFELRRCIITGNIAVNKGSAVFAESRININNSLIYRNSALGLLTSYAELENNTFVLNTGGGAMIADKSPSVPWGYVRNSVFWGNGGIQFGRGNTPVTYCGIEGELFEGEGNLRLNASNMAFDGPRFRNPSDTSFRGFDLGCGSILKDRGTGRTVTETDLAGNPRILNGRIDIGALETLLGSTPVKPQVNEREIFTCQYEQQQIYIPNSVPDTKIYAISQGWKIPLNDSLIIGAELPGKVLYEIVRQDSSGCISEADTIIVGVYEAIVPADFRGTSTICAGENAVLTYTPVEGYTYELFDQGQPLFPGSSTIDHGQIIVNQPSGGAHSYTLRSLIAHEEHQCVSGFTQPVEVSVLEGQRSDGSSLELVKGGEGAVWCQGDEIEIVYKYTNGVGTINGAEAVGLPEGMTALLETDKQTITISGRPSSNFTYVIRTKGELSCAAAREIGVVKLNPKPLFGLGK